MVGYLRSDPRRLRGRLSEADAGIHLLTSPLRIPRREGLVADLARGSAARAVRRAIRLSEFEKPLLWASAPSAETLVGQVGESAVLYDCPDDLRSLGADDVALAREAKLEAKADLILTCVPSVQELKLQSARNVACVANGVDAAHFAASSEPGPIPARLSGLPRPIVGYSGVVYDRIDWELVESVCSMRPDWTILFMGLVQQPPPERVRSLRNLHILGEVSFEDLPDYYRTIDVCWVPHRVNTLTSRQSSLKVLEYLAAGRPVVTTDIPLPSDVMPLVEVRKNSADIVDALSLAAGRDSQADRHARQDVAANHSWDRSFEEIEHVMAAVGV
jgi:glycosyltransferase involved in cell wall biosynthesis